jgi:hypothetical protein
MPPALSGTWNPNILTHSCVKHLYLSFASIYSVAHLVDMVETAWKALKTPLGPCNQTPPLERLNDPNVV